MYKIKKMRAANTGLKKELAGPKTITPNLKELARTYLQLKGRASPDGKTART